MNYYEHAQISRQHQLSMEQVEKLIEHLQEQLKECGMSPLEKFSEI